MTSFFTEVLGFLTLYSWILKLPCFFWSMAPCAPNACISSSAGLGWGQAARSAGRNVTVILEMQQSQFLEIRCWSPEERPVGRVGAQKRKGR